MVQKNPSTCSLLLYDGKIHFDPLLPPATVGSTAAAAAATTTTAAAANAANAGQPWALPPTPTPPPALQRPRKRPAAAAGIEAGGKRQQAASKAGAAYSILAAQRSTWAATEALAKDARQKAAEAAQAATELEAQAAVESRRVDAAVAEYQTLKSIIKKGYAGFRAQTGHEPRKLSECPDDVRAAWKRRMELRREFPSRPWAKDNGEGGGSSSAQEQASAVPTAARQL